MKLLKTTCQKRKQNSLEDGIGRHHIINLMSTNTCPDNIPANMRVCFVPAKKTNVIAYTFIYHVQLTL